MLNEIVVLIKLESGDDKEESKGVTGNQAMALGRQIFPRGKGWRK